MNLENIFKKINFVNRYKKLCRTYNDFDNSLTGNKKKIYQEILERIIGGDNVIYYSKDKMYQVNFDYREYSINLGLSLHDGLVEARLFYIRNEEWLVYNRFDFLSEELEQGFRSQFTIPKYSSYDELEEILKEIFSIYEDFKKEFIKQYS